MDTGAVTRKGEAVLGNEAVLTGGEDGGEAENLLEPILEMKREFLVFQCVSGHRVRNAGVLIGKFLSFSGLFRRLCVFILREKVFPAGAL